MARVEVEGGMKKMNTPQLTSLHSGELEGVTVDACDQRGEDRVEIELIELKRTRILKAVYAD